MKKTLTLTAIAFICLSLHNNLDAQNSFSNKSVFTVEELKQDFSALRSSIEESHPGLYLYKSKSIIDSIFNANYSSLNKAIPGRKFILLT